MKEGTSFENTITFVFRQQSIPAGTSILKLHVQFKQHLNTAKSITGKEKEAFNN
jgi:hypothetical protein